jgi:integrase|tara:strand:+ start:223 stop:534 length:312 start_codon:yes stop_codon:yes gene_type:complete
VGTAVGQSSIRLRYKKLLATAGVPSITFHELRHSFAVLGLLNDIPIEQIQEAVGHSSIQTTKDIYANHLPDLAVKAVTALNDILDPQPEGRHLKIVASNDHRN